MAWMDRRGELKVRKGLRAGLRQSVETIREPNTVLLGDQPCEPSRGNSHAESHRDTCTRELRQRTRTRKCAILTSSQSPNPLSPSRNASASSWPLLGISRPPKRHRAKRNKLTVEPPLLPEEAHVAVGVAPHETEDHGRLLAALEAVDAPELDARVSLLEGG